MKTYNPPRMKRTLIGLAIMGISLITPGTNAFLIPFGCILMGGYSIDSDKYLLKLRQLRIKLMWKIK